MRILLAEDEKNLRDVLKLNLQMEDFETIVVENGLMALQKFHQEHFDLVILDVMMPEMDGYMVCEKIRLENADIPILFLTAKDNSSDRIMGFKKGADDYLTKPFNLEEFLFRVKSLVKRNKMGKADGQKSLYKFGGNEIDFQSYKAIGINGSIELTKKEMELLKLLIDRKNEVVSRNEILKIVWGYDVYPSTRTIDNFILNFRKHFEQDLKNPVFFKSIRGIGYKFIEEK
jgi:two-component system alkaline phosphatase synthesis response regulator PhoP